MLVKMMAKKEETPAPKLNKVLILSYLCFTFLISNTNVFLYFQGSSEQLPGKFDLKAVLPEGTALYKPRAIKDRDASLVFHGSCSYFLRVASKSHFSKNF